MPNAEIVFDVFHVMQFVHKALDEVRRIEAKQHKILLEKTRYLWLKDGKNLSETKRKRLECRMRQNEALAI